ncbi:signal peptidase I [Sphingomonas sp.]|uniref:signal peptidase I n=1 Tax=Sphingomonas sp. TaxID=28214 RepID=UPI0025D9ADF5|nr:signal peptidase I [Sphingomonas sp.]MBV9527242.1 signal peptidase I [Sphingomonas sp.]
MPSPVPSSTADDGASAPKPEKTETAGSLARFLLSIALIAWAMRSLFIQPFSIPSGSMLPALFIGDYIAVSKWPYGYSRYSFPWSFPPINGRIFAGLPKRGDVVVFHLPSENADLVKRVIGLPGDTVEVRGGALILNGRIVPRRPLSPVAMPISPNSPCRVIPPAQPDVVERGGHPYCLYPALLESLPGGPSYTVLDQVDASAGDNFGPAKVPAGRLFLMGDNRDDSLDSRFPTDEGGVDMLPLEDVIGRAQLTFWSTDGSASYVKPWTWFTALRARRIGNGYTGPAR